MEAAFRNKPRIAVEARVPKQASDRGIEARFMLGMNRAVRRATSTRRLNKARGMKNAKLLRWMRNGGFVLLAAMLSGCGEEYLQSTINPVTDYGEVSQRLYVQVFWWTMIILAVVWALMAYILIRFREKPGQERPKQIHGHMGLEIAWTIAPAIIVVAIVIPTIQGVFQLQTASGRRRSGGGGNGQTVLVELPLSRSWASPPPTSFTFRWAGP